MPSHGLTPEQIRMLREVDVDAALKRIAQLFNYIPDYRINAEAGLHKARIIEGEPTFTAKEIAVSIAWLKANNFEVP